GQEQLARGLIERARFEGRGCRLFARYGHHALGGHVEMRADPVVVRIEPDVGVPLGPPAGKRRLRDLALWMALEVLERGHGEDGRLRVQLPEDARQEPGPLVPPVAEELGV